MKRQRNCNKRTSSSKKQNISPQVSNQNMERGACDTNEGGSQRVTRNKRIRINKNVEGYRSGAHITCRSNLVDVIEGIKDGLDEQNLRNFQKSCFGKFLDLPPMKIQLQLIYHVMLQLKHGPSNQLVFEFDGKEMVFGHEEYFMLTGLSFGAENELPETSKIHQTVFRCCSDLNLKDIEIAFKTECESSEGGTELCYQLALLWFMYGSLFGRHKTNKKINLHLMHIVDDVHTFNSYPWGAKSYEFFVKKWFSSSRKMHTSLADNGVAVFDLYGLVFAIQCWVYECNSDIVKYCANRLQGYEHVWPRMLRWSTTSFKYFTSLKKFFNNATHMKWVRMQGSGEEEILLRAARSHLSTFHVKYECSNVFGRERLGSTGETYMMQSMRKKTCSLSSEASPLNKKAPTEECDNFESAIKHENIKSGCDCHDKVQEELEKLSEKVKYLSMQVDLISRNNNPITPPKSHNNLGDGLVSHLQILSTGITTVKCNVVQPPDIKEGCKSPKWERCSGYRVEDDQSVEQLLNNHNIRSKRKNAEPDHIEELAIEHVSPELKKGRSPIDPLELTSSNDNSKYEENVSHLRGLKKMLMFNKEDNEISKSHMMHDPNNLPSNEDIINFQNWIREAHDENKNVKVKLPMKRMKKLHWSWFHGLKTGNIWLTNWECDVLINFLLLKRKNNPSLFTSNWTMLEAVCWDKMTDIEYEKSVKVMLQYVNGALPQEDGRPWAQVEHVYGIAHVLTNHWVAYDINMKEKRVTVYDSMSKVNGWTSVRKEFEKLCKFIPWILNVAAAGNVTGEKWEYNKWELVQYRHPPQQVNSNDCGVMAIKYLECLITANPVDIITPKWSTVFRTAYCVEVLKIASAC